MSNPEISYERTRELTNEGYRFYPSPIILKNGMSLDNVTPYVLVPATRGDQSTLEMLYIDSDEKLNAIDVRDISGFDVVEGDGEYSGRLLVSFHYYKPNKDASRQTVEEKPRQILVTGLMYGLHPSHEKYGESFDIYIVGEDTQYTDKPLVERIRHFPLWRTGAYGDPKTIEANFKERNEL